MSSKKQSITRKEFLKKSGLGIGAFTIVPAHVLGGKSHIAPSDMITMGFIGCGKQSPGLSTDIMNVPGVRMIAASDVDSVKMTKFQEHVSRFYQDQGESYSSSICKGYHDYEDLLAQDEIDAVVICTPDHWHANQAIHALKAGKDVYCEKPLSHTVEEGRAMVAATRKNDRIFQTGSMQRSWSDFRQACELVRGGYLGEITSVKVNVGGPSRPYNLDEEPMRPELNWDKWIGPAFYQYYNSILAPAYPLVNWPRWRSFSEFGGGGVTDWGAHMFDIVQWALGMDDTGPVEFHPPKLKSQDRGFNFKYANGVHVTHIDFGRGNAVEFTGTEGTLTVSREFLETSIPMLHNREFSEEERQLKWTTNHYQDFVDCIKTREKPVADVEIGHRTATICNIGNITYQLGRSLEWDPNAERFLNDDYANSKLGKQYRKGFELPAV